MRPRRQLISVALGFSTGLLTLVAVAVQIDRWSRIEALRAPPVSQAGFFVASGLLTAMALLEIALARLPGSTGRAIGMTAVSGALAIVGAIAGGAGTESAAVLFYAGVVGIVGAVAAVIEAPRPIVAAFAGVLGSMAMAAGVQILAVSIGRAFP